MNELSRSEVLCIPKRRRLVHNRVRDAAGQEVLHVYYGDKELIFDEPELLPFGAGLLAAERFRAEEAMAWADGAPHTWEKVRELLETLLENAILERVKEGAPAANAKRAFPETLEPPSAPKEPRSFGTHHDQCPALTREAFGRAVDSSNLELVIPVYRVAHPALDGDGRQVGENNVGPRSLFLDLPTQRRVCHYPGSRYDADVPMNVTALRHMTSRWPELLSLTEQFREGFFERVPPRGAELLAGEVQLLSVCCLAAVGYVMMRGAAPFANGQLDAGLAAMFRLIDGVRLVTTEMLRATPGAHGCERPVNAQSIADYAEQHLVYHGVYGVCAGPQALIDEYLRVLLGEARAPIRAEPDLAARLGDLDAALDYGLLGQRSECIIRTFGAEQGLINERLRAVLRGAAGSPELQRLASAPVDAEHYPQLRETHSLLDTFELELSINRWMFEHAGRGLPAAWTASAPALTPVFHLDSAAQAESRAQLSAFFAGLTGAAALGEALRLEVAGLFADGFALERRCLRAAEREQTTLNRRLQREPGRPVTGADIAIYTRPRCGPPLAETLGVGFGVTVTSDAARTVLYAGEHSVTLSG